MSTQKAVPPKVPEKRASAPRTNVKAKQAKAMADANLALRGNSFQSPPSFVVPPNQTNTFIPFHNLNQNSALAHQAIMQNDALNQIQMMRMPAISQSEPSPRIARIISIADQNGQPLLFPNAMQPDQMPCVTGTNVVIKEVHEAPDKRDEVGCTSRS
ncbi:hypothetical protein QAD02_000839 [Eretmocerus hayati]|uniref:Uncharacterized protein n=1 Tax=Eretmocerus hayati TaxID=131215 RepID=A0ACC2NEE9_9HYME|nr:hypothetical protein QAD02_000839 [Eretmocerus hayati]